MSVFEITKAATFDAAHHFPSEPEESLPAHPWSFLPGRSDRLQRNAGCGAWLGRRSGRPGPGLEEAAEALDHGMLNEHAGLELPSLENLCLWFAGRLKPEWPGLSRIMVSRPTIHERCVLTL